MNQEDILLLKHKLEKGSYYITDKLSLFKKAFPKASVNVCHSNIYITDKTPYGEKTVLNIHYDPLYLYDGLIKETLIKAVDILTKEEKFWIVWSPQGKKPPQVKHNSKEKAEYERKRLMDIFPSQDFYVLTNTVKQ